MYVYINEQLPVRKVCHFKSVFILLQDNILQMQSSWLYLIKLRCFFTIHLNFSKTACNKTAYPLYRVIQKPLWDFRPLQNSDRDGHAQGEHVNRGRDTPSFCPPLQVLDMSFLMCLSWLLRNRFRKFRRDLWITLYVHPVPLSKHTQFRL